MKLPQVMAPAIRLAEDGFIISPTLSGVVVDNFEEIAKNEPLAKVVCPTGLPLEAGGVLKNPDLAASLRKIAAGGADVFYRGELAESITAEMAANGGFITKADLSSYRAVERTPVRGRYRGYEIISAPPPVGGVTVVETLQILDQLDLAKHRHLSVGHIHLVAEALKRGFADYSAFVARPGLRRRSRSPACCPRRTRRCGPPSIDSARVSEKVTAGEPAKVESPEHHAPVHRGPVGQHGRADADAVRFLRSQGR